MRWIFASLFVYSFLQTAQAEPCVLMDLEMAWSRVMAYAPSIAAADAEIGVREGEKRQVSLLPNPIAVIEADNVGVSHPNEDAEPPETTFAISQLIELGGKRCARRDFASSLTELAFWDAQIERLDLRLAFTIAFIDVATAQEKLMVAENKLAVAQQMHAAICTQVDAGKVSIIQEKKAQLALTAAQFVVQEAYSAFTQTKNRLATFWGCSCADFDQVIFSLDPSSCPPCTCALLQSLYETPDFARAQRVICSAQKNLKLQKVNAIPDVTLTVGYSVFHDSGQHGWVFGAEFPIPIFNCNQGNVQRARSEICQAEYQLDEVIRALTEKITLAHTRMVTAFDESNMMRCNVLCDACETMELIQAGYENGKIDYLDLLDAQKTLFEIQEKYIDILYDYQISKAELERLIGGRI